MDKRTIVVSFEIYYKWTGLPINKSSNLIIILLDDYHITGTNEICEITHYYYYF
jgi:hypothetical protein